MKLEDKINVMQTNNNICISHYIQKVGDKFILNKKINLFKVDIEEEFYYLETENNEIYFDTLENIKIWLNNNNYYKYELEFKY